MPMFSCTIITPPSSLPSQLGLGSWPLSLPAGKPQSKSSSCKSLEAEFRIHKMRTFYTLSLHDRAASSTLLPAQSQSRAPHYLLPRKGTLPQPQPAQGATLTWPLSRWWCYSDLEQGRYRRFGNHFSSSILKANTSGRKPPRRIQGHPAADRQQ